MKTFTIHRTRIQVTSTCDTCLDYEVGNEARVQRWQREHRCDAEKEAGSA